MTDRDTFAAAALIGFIAYGDYSPEDIPEISYRMADAMPPRVPWSLLRAWRRSC